MKFLFVYTKHASKGSLFQNFWSKRTNNTEIPPRQLLIPSIHIPINWDRKFVDLNQRKLQKNDVDWADYIFVYADLDQSESTLSVIKQFRLKKKKVIGCGSYFKTHFEKLEDLEHIILKNPLDSFQSLVHDLENQQAQKIYETEKRQGIVNRGPYFSLNSLSNKFAGNIHLSYG